MENNNHDSHAYCNTRASTPTMKYAYARYTLYYAISITSYAPYTLKIAQFPPASPSANQFETVMRENIKYTFFSYKNHVYKNVEAQIAPKIKNVVVILLVAISISF